MIVKLEMSESKKWLIKLIAQHRRILSDMLNRFLDDRKFDQRVQKFEEGDPIQRERIKYLTLVEN